MVICKIRDTGKELDVYGFESHGKGLDLILLAIKSNWRVPNKEKRWGSALFLKYFSACFVEMSYG